MSTNNMKDLIERKDKEFDEKFCKGQDRVPYYMLVSDAKPFLHQAMQEAYEQGQRGMDKTKVWSFASLVRGQIKRFIEDQQDHEVHDDFILQKVPSLVEHVICDELLPTPSKENDSK